MSFQRGEDGILVMSLHKDGGPLTFTARDHESFVDAFYDVSRDRDNKVVILTGAGGHFMPDIDFTSFGDVSDPDVWSKVHDEGTQILENLANIRVPMIWARWKARRTSMPIRSSANVIVAGEDATFDDLPISLAASSPGTASSRFGATSSARAARRPCCSIPSRSPRDKRRIWASWPRSWRPAARSRATADRDDLPREDGGHATKHAHPFHTTDQGAHRSRGGLRLGARGRLGVRSGQEPSLQVSYQGTLVRHEGVMAKAFWRSPTRPRRGSPVRSSLSTAE